MAERSLTVLELAERYAHGVLTDQDISALFAEANRLQGALETANLKVQRLERDNDRLEDRLTANRED